MHRWFTALVLTGASLGFWAASGQARVAFIPPPPPAVQIGQAEMVMVGRVIGLEPKDLDIPVAPGAKEMMKFRIAVVKVVDPILGAKDLKTVRVGFVPTPSEPQPGRPIRNLPGQNPNLEVGMNALFFLNRQAASKDLFVGDGIYTIRVLGDEPDNPDLKALKTLAKLLEDPMAGLKAKAQEDRFKTATMLVHKYRTFRGPGQPKEEMIPAEESKLILAAIKEGNWNEQPGRGRPVQGSLQLFFQLGVNEKDGWNPKGDTPIAKEAQAWLEKNADTYRIKRFVPAPAAQPGAGAGVRLDVIRD